MTDINSERIAQTQPIHKPLICGLPDDIALFCLARVPRKYHSLLKCVSKGWRELVSSAEWLSYRQRNNLSESWVYVMCRDKTDRLGRVCFYVLDPISSKRCWKLVPSLPDVCLKRKGMSFEVLGSKVYLLGGCGWFEDATDEVYCYDAIKNSWDKSAPLSTARSYFACEALNNKLYAIGGVGSNSSDPRSWDTYDPCTDSWTSHSDLNIVPDIEESFVLDGKIYIRCGASSNVPPHVYAVVYKPSSGTWEHADNDLVSGWSGPAVVVDENLYVLDQSSGTRLMMWQKESREWVAVGRLSPLLTKPPCRLAGVGKSIVVIGKGLSTVVFDVGRRGGNMGGLMVSSSIPRLGNVDIDDIISCKVLSI